MKRFRSLKNFSFASRKRRYYVRSKMCKSEYERRAEIFAFEKLTLTYLGKQNRSHFVDASCLAKKKTGCGCNMDTECVFRE